MKKASIIRTIEEINKDIVAEGTKASFEPLLLATLYHERGEVFFSKNKYKKACADFAKGLEIINNPESAVEIYAKCYYRHICAFITQDRIFEARKLSKLPIGLCRTNILAAGILMGESLLEYREKNDEIELEKIVKTIDEVLELIENFSFAHALKGLVYKKMWSIADDKKNYFKLAEASFKAAYKSDVKNIDARRNHGELLLDRGTINDVENAIKIYELAAKLAPEYAKAYHSLALAYYKKARMNSNDIGGLKNAINQFEIAKNLYQSDDIYHANRVRDYIAEIRCLKKCGDCAEESKDSTDYEAKIIKLLNNTQKCANSIESTENLVRQKYDFKKKKSASQEFRFEVLQRWNSDTPIVASNRSASKGGGFFMQYKGEGIVVDPGFNFMQNFIDAGHYFSEIDHVFISHAHNDHAADLESILTILYRYNQGIEGSYDKLREGTAFDNTLRKLNMSRKNYKQGVDRVKFDDVLKDSFKPKKIKLYITSSVLKKYSSILNLYKKFNYTVVIVGDDYRKENELTVIKDSLYAVPIRAFHDDLFSDYSSVGFCFRFEDKAIVYTGDTGYYGGDGSLKDEYEKMKKDLAGKQIVLIANLGGFKDSELDFREKYSTEFIKKCFYKNHLGRLGVYHLILDLKPEYCVISEMGEELKGCRVNISAEFSTATDIMCLPADIGLVINGSLDIEAIKTNPDIKLGEKDFYKFKEVRAYEMDEIGKIYYYHICSTTISDVEEKLRAKIIRKEKEDISKLFPANKKMSHFEKSKGSY